MIDSAPARQLRANSNVGLEPAAEAWEVRAAMGRVAAASALMSREVAIGISAETEGGHFHHRSAHAGISTPLRRGSAHDVRWTWLGHGAGRYNSGLTSRRRDGTHRGVWRDNFGRHLRRALCVAESARGEDGNEGKTFGRHDQLQMSGQQVAGFRCQSLWTSPARVRPETHLHAHVTPMKYRRTTSGWPKTTDNVRQARVPSRKPLGSSACKRASVQ